MTSTLESTEQMPTQDKSFCLSLEQVDDIVEQLKANMTRYYQSILTFLDKYSEFVGTKNAVIAIKTVVEFMTRPTTLEWLNTSYYTDFKMLTEKISSILESALSKVESTLPHADMLAMFRKCTPARQDRIAGYEATNGSVATIGVAMYTRNSCCVKDPLNPEFTLTLFETSDYGDMEHFAESVAKFSNAKKRKLLEKSEIPSSDDESDEGTKTLKGKSPPKFKQEEPPKKKRRVLRY